jgi:hypothetical protein
MMSNLYAEAIDYLDAGLRLIPLYPMINGKCGCPDSECTAIAKHPLRSNWQHQDLVDVAVVKEVWIDVYTCNGLGWALNPRHIVLDVDPRNGGTKSLALLEKDLGINFIDECNAIVKTGGGGLHFYFEKESESSLGWKLDSKYRGLDIKMAGGFVVAAGSVHASGNDYEWYSAAKSDLQKLSFAPKGLIELLTKTYQEHRTAVNSAGLGDIDEIEDMLSFINPSLDYHTWSKIGMAIHHATSGTGVAIWDKWSSQSEKYRQGECEKKWHSYGKNTGEPVTMGTLHTIAKAAGWEKKQDPSFLEPVALKALQDQWRLEKESLAAIPSIADDSDLDLFKPPGLLGKINDYVYSCSVFPNKNLALACSLSVLTNVIGRKYYWPGRFSNIQPNLLVLCIAGSSVGKDSVLGAAHKLLSSVGLQPAIHGRIKSDKDLLDALQRHQYALYFNDEFGYFLQRLNNAMTKGSASYLEGIIGTIMEVFTKGDKSVLLDISRKLEIKEFYEEAIRKASVAAKDGDKPELADKKLARAKMLMEKFSGGLPNPFLSMFTTATPRTMELAFSGEATENGFLSRAMTFHEYETNPRPRPDFEGAQEVPLGLQMALTGVKFDRDECPFGRIDSFNQIPVAIKIDSDAQIFVERAIEYFFELAETQKESGLESLPRRALDGIIKVCIALAAQDRRLTLQMARYAVKLVRSEIDKKIQRVNSTENMASRDNGVKMGGIKSRIMEVCDTINGELIGTIQSRCKTSKVNPSNIVVLVEGMVDSGFLLRENTGRKYKDAAVFRYKSVNK